MALMRRGCLKIAKLFETAPLMRKTTTMTTTMISNIVVVDWKKKQSNLQSHLRIDGPLRIGVAKRRASWNRRDGAARLSNTIRFPCDTDAQPFQLAESCDPREDTEKTERIAC